MPEPLTPTVLIVGGGPSGLAAAAALAGAVPGEVLVVERETEAGGIPRHSDHLGYGIRDLHRILDGPTYARRLVAAALDAGATIRTEAMVTNWRADGSAEVTSPQGRIVIQPGATILATGARERPRAARLIPGDRPQGVLTTGQLQNLVHLHHRRPGRRAVVVGAELVSWSAVLTLRGAGCRTVLMTTTQRTPEAYGALTFVGQAAMRTRVATRTRVTKVVGAGRVRAVEVEDLATGGRRLVECDTVVFTGDWAPDNELVRSAGLDLDPGTLGPQVDAGLRTSRPGVFAVGNLVHPVDTADVAAIDGAHVAAGVRAWLAGDGAAPVSSRILVEPPLRWVAPNVLSATPGAPARDRLLAWTEEFVRSPTVVVRQGGRVVASRRLPWPAAPGRVFRIPASLVRDVDPARGDLVISVAPTTSGGGTRSRAQAGRT